jgi:hypothetical protein
VCAGVLDLEVLRDFSLHKIFLRRGEKGEFPSERLSHYYEDWLGFPFWKIDPHFSLKENREGRKFALILQPHHPLSDGLSVKKLTSAYLAREETQMEVPRKNGRLLNLEFLTRALPETGMELMRYMFLDRDVNPWQVPLSGLSGLWHCVLLDPVAFPAVRSASKTLGVTPLTSFLLDGIAGGLRRYWANLKAGGEVTEIPWSMRITFPWPVENHPNLHFEF